MALKIPENRDENKKKSSTPSARGLRVNYLIILLSGLLLLMGGFLVFLLIVKNVYGNYELKEILPTKENFEKLAYEHKAALLYPQYTENRFPEGSTWVQDNISTWETYLKNVRMNYDLITDLDIEKGKHFDYKLLILAGVQVLSDLQIKQIKIFLDRGGSIFATGGTASYSDQGKWRGWEFFTEVYGLKFNREIKPDELYKVHTLRGNLPITAEIPTGYALKIATWDRPIYAEVLEPRVTQVSFWYDYRREAGLVREGVQKSAGIAYGNYGKGRFVWYGFQLNSVIGQQQDYIFFEKLFRNSINWLTYNPTSFIKDWPAPYKAAALIIPTVSYNSGNIANATQLLRGLGYEPTVFVDAALAYDKPRLLGGLGQVNQLGVLADVGFVESASDTVNRLFDKETQREVLSFARDTLYSITRSPVKGFMPLYGFYNENTLQAMSNYGYDFLITDSLTDRSVPKIEFRNGRPLMIITKTARDDYEVIRKYGLSNTEFQEYTYEEDIDRLLFEGGLYVLKVHTDAQLLSQYAGVLPNLISYMKSKGIWLTTIPQLQNWWRQKGGIEVRYETRSKRRVTLEVSNPRETQMTDFVVQINLNKEVTDIEISSEIINTKLPEYQFDSSTNILYLYIDELEAGETRIYIVDFRNVTV
ncbi:MAG: hypothetical protein JW995_00680 [Melioribacteraceae bacterium]|nr:hypothetical protein [Melioribacteraceae bacterium]